jgi:hypothetical protein
MDKWEYLTKFVSANIDTENAKEFFQQRWPEWKTPPKFTPQAMIPELNAWGEEGWEVVHMQPVWIGKNHDLHNYGYSYAYTNVYFCVMKRRKQTG